MPFSNADANDVGILVHALSDIADDNLRATIGRLISRKVLIGTRLKSSKKSGINWSGVAAAFPDECEQMYQWIRDNGSGTWDKIPLIKQLRTFGVPGLLDAKQIIEGPHFCRYVN